MTVPFTERELSIILHGGVHHQDWNTDDWKALESLLAKVRLAVFHKLPATLPPTASPGEEQSSLGPQARGRRRVIMRRVVKAIVNSPPPGSVKPRWQLSLECGHIVMARAWGGATFSRHGCEQCFREGRAR